MCYKLTEQASAYEPFGYRNIHILIPYPINMADTLIVELITEEYEFSLWEIDSE
jgi:ppGpp synthetase/RelA/SpoT-type nucleotidyltranferase